MLTAGSLFSGIGGLDHGLQRAGFAHVFLCESDGWRRGVLRERFPGVPIYEDVASVAACDHSAWAVGRGARRRTVGGGGRGTAADGSLGGTADALDLLAGGFPCQDLSVAGQRRGLAGDRSGLFFEFARVTDALRPRWLFVENVPGLLSSNGGRDFGVVLGTLADLGYGLAWRVLDSRFFGVPQRRRRVFVVGARVVGDPRAAAERAGEVLAVGSRCPGHPATRGEAREEPAVASLSGLGSGGPDDNDGQGGRLVAEPVVAFNSYGGAGRDSMLGASEPGIAPTSKRKGMTTIANGASVRRLTPTECERLQALPDQWTRVPDSAPDSRRYAGLGDAVTASVAEWIGRRIIARSAA